MKIIRKDTGGSRRLYLASLNPDLEKEILLPTVPDNFLTRGKFEDWQIKRICLYGNIDDALSGLLQQKLNDKLVYIYEPVACKYENLIKPGITSIPYILALPEWWYCNSLRVRLTHVIQVDKEEKPLEFRYGPRQTKSKILRWKWKEKQDKYGKGMVIKRFSEQPQNDPKAEKRKNNFKDAAIGAGAGIALLGNKLVKKAREKEANLETEVKQSGNRLGDYLKKHTLNSDASAEWRHNSSKIKAEGEKKLGKIAKQHKTASKIIAGTAIGTAIAAGVAREIKRKKQEDKK